MNVCCMAATAICLIMLEFLFLFKASVPAKGWHTPGFLELLLSMNVYVRVCVSALRLLITGGMMWCDIDTI